MTTGEPRNPFRDQYLAYLRRRGPRGPELRRLYVLGGLMALLVVFLLLFAPAPTDGARHQPDAAGSGSAPLAAVQDPELLEGMRAERRRRLAEEYGGALVEVENGAGFVQTAGYRRLLQALLDHAPAQASRTAAYLDHRLALEAPELLQGERVRVRGILVDWWPVRLNEPLWGREDVFRAFLGAADGTDWVVVDLLERPENVTRAIDAVEVQGMFYRTVSYEVANPAGGDIRRTVPYLLALAVTPLVSTTTPTSFLEHNSVIFLAVLGLGVLWLVFRVVVLVRQRRARAAAPAPAGFHALFERRLGSAGDAAMKSPDRKRGP